MTNNNGIYVTGCVIPNGIPDHENDVLTKKDIKIILTKFLEHQTDTEHNYLKNNGVDTVENGISDTDKMIDGKIAPAGSWLVTYYITNPQIIESILSDDPNSINGLSLGSVPKNITDIDYWFINKSINYRDLKDTEEVIPKFISFVAKPSNGFGLEVEEYEVYINKSVSEEFEMTNTNETHIEEEKLTLSGWAKIMKTLGINKSADAGATETEQEVKVETEPVKTEEVKDISNKELLEKIPNAVATGITSAFEKMGETKQAPVEPIEKSETDEEEVEVEEEPEVTEPVEEVEVEEPASKTKEAGIQKSATEKVENTTKNPNTSTNFYKKSGRDMFGCRIKK